MTSVSPSCSHQVSRSLPLMSALLPSETKLESPRSLLLASARMAIPSPPDWDAKPTRPAIGTSAANVAFIDTAGAVFKTPKQLGPTMRML